MKEGKQQKMKIKIKELNIKKKNRYGIKNKKII